VGFFHSFSQLFTLDYLKLYLIDRKGAVHQRIRLFLQGRETVVINWDRISMYSLTHPVTKICQVKSSSG